MGLILYLFFLLMKIAYLLKKISVNPETDIQNRLFFAKKFEIIMNKFSYHLGSGFEC